MTSARANESDSRQTTEDRNSGLNLKVPIEDIEEKKIKEFADKNPEAAADLIKAWLKENN